MKQEKCSCTKKGYVVFTKKGRCIRCGKKVDAPEKDVWDEIVAKAVIQSTLDYFKSRHLKS